MNDRRAWLPNYDDDESELIDPVEIERKLDEALEQRPELRKLYEGDFSGMRLEDRNPALSGHLRDAGFSRREVQFVLENWEHSPHSSPRSPEWEHWQLLDGDDVLSPDCRVAVNLMTGQGALYRPARATGDSTGAEELAATTANRATATGGWTTGARSAAANRG
jgi:hypothetical protein